MVSGTRLLPLLPGIGPGKARQLMDMLLAGRRQFRRLGRVEAARRARRSSGRSSSALLSDLTDTSDDLPTQLHRVRKFYTPLLEAKYDHVEPRLRDLEQLELIASRYRSRPRMLLEMTLDPPSSTQDLAGPPVLGRRLPGAEHDPFGQGAGMGRGLRDPRRRRQHPLRHGHEEPGGDRGGAAAVLRGPDAGEELALRLLSACATTGPAAATITRFAQRTRFLPDKVLKCFEQCVTDPLGDDDADDLDDPGDSSHRTTSRSSAGGRRICGDDGATRPHNV